MIPWFKFIYIQRYPSIIAKSMIYVLGYLLRNHIKSVLHHIPTNNDANFQSDPWQFQVLCLSTPFIVSLLRIICGEINDPTESVSYILKDRLSRVLSTGHFVEGLCCNNVISSRVRINRNWSKGMLEQS